MRMKTKMMVVFSGCALLVAAGCKKEDKASLANARDASRKTVFVEVSESAGITHKHYQPILDRKLDNIMSWVSSVGAAAAAGDFDNDGWLDLYVTNSRKGKPNYLYRNRGDGTFEDVAAKAGLANVNDDTGTSMDCVWGDIDNDGWQDLYIVKWGSDMLFRNRGDGTFENVTEKLLTKRDGSAGVDWANGNAAIFFDYDRDGRLDIYVGNYFDEVDLWNLESTRIMHDDFEKARNGGRNYLYHQQSDGTFKQIAKSLGVDDPGWTLAVGSADLNNDGWPDLYSADDFGPDQLFLNDGNGGFKNVSDTAIGFDTKKGMNIDFGDFNNDGWLDAYVANITTAEYLQEGNMLWHNNGVDDDGNFTMTDIAHETGTYDGGWGWGAKFFDYDNDGDLDLLAVNGFISKGEGDYWFDLASWTVLGQDAAEATNWPEIGNRSFSGYEPFRFWQNDGFESFSQRTHAVGLDSDRDGRGLVVFDYDNDGDLDTFIANQDQQPQLFRNDHTDAGHWLAINLETDSSTNVTHDAVGTRVTVVTDQGQQIREREGGNGYAGQSDPRLHFGLGDAEKIALIEIRWPDGGRQYLENIPADQFLTIRQDPSQYVDTSLINIAAPKSRDHDAEADNTLDVDESQVEAILSQAENAVRDNPASHSRAGIYRTQCARFGQQDRAIDFLKSLADEHSNEPKLQIELSCAYVDKIPACGGIAAVVSKGTYARKSLDVLNALVDNVGGSWAIYYARGMNHLHWPKMLRHSATAAADFERCLKLQNESAQPADQPHHERIHVLLGDAYAKNDEFDKARKAWKNGLKFFPNSPDLKERLAVDGDRNLKKFIAAARSLEQPINTNLAFLDNETDVN